MSVSLTSTSNSDTGGRSSPDAEDDVAGAAAAKRRVAEFRVRGESRSAGGGASAMDGRRADARRASADAVSRRGRRDATRRERVRGVTRRHRGRSRGEE